MNTSPPKHFRPLTARQQETVLRSIDAAELAALGAVQSRPTTAAEHQQKPIVSDGTASAQRLQEALRTGGLSLVPMSDAITASMGAYATRRTAAQPPKREAMTADTYRLRDDSIPVLRMVGGTRVHAKSEPVPFRPAPVWREVEDDEDALASDAARPWDAAEWIAAAIAFAALPGVLYMAAPWVLALAAKVTGG